MAGLISYRLLLLRFRVEIEFSSVRSSGWILMSTNQQLVMRSMTRATSGGVIGGLSAVTSDGGEGGVLGIVDMVWFSGLDLGCRTCGCAPAAHELAMALPIALWVRGP
jgi:hypothetical protein